MLYNVFLISMILMNPGRYNYELDGKRARAETQMHIMKRIDDVAWKTLSFKTKQITEVNNLPKIFKRKDNNFLF